MAAPKPAPKTDQVVQMVEDLIQSTVRDRSPNDFDFRLVEREALALTRADALSGYMALAELNQLCGGFERAFEFTEKVRKLGGRSQADFLEAIFLANQGQFSQAARRLERQDPSVWAEHVNAFRTTATCGAFDLHLQVASAVEKATLESPDSTLTHSAQKALAVLRDSHSDEAHVQRVLDVAGLVLRRHKLWWLGRSPDIEVIDVEGHKSIFYRFEVQTSAAEAAQLTFELVELFIEQEIDPAPVSVCFVGTELNEHQPH